MQRKSIYSLGSLALLLSLFVGLNMLSGNSLRGLRFDLTDNRLFTLSEGTRNMLAGVQEPVTLYFYFSQASSRDIPQIRSYAKRVDELLQEFENHGAGKLTVVSVQAPPCQRTWRTAARAVANFSTVMSRISSRNIRLRSCA